VQHLGRGQSPVHGDCDGAQFRQAANDFEELGAVLFDERDPLAEPDPGSPERLGGLAGPLIELGEGDGAVVAS
jgi:hypothetical protein